MTPEPATSARGARRAAILVAEDDPASGQFFAAALAACGCEASMERNGLAALALARQQGFDLLLLDCHMPGANAMQILTALRADPGSASHASPAIATSAELDAAQRTQLRQAGFADTLSKPVALERLQATVQASLSRQAAPVPLLDDGTALQSSGSATAVSALRGLFAGELRRLANELDSLAAQPARLAERLHRLLASCGFCGATALADACRHLKQPLERGAAPAPVELERFRQTLARTLLVLTEEAPDDQSDDGVRGTRSP